MGGDFIAMILAPGTFPPPIFTITADPDSKFAIVSGNQLVVRQGATFHHLSDETHSVTIRADNGVGLPVTQPFTITVIEDGFLMSSTSILLSSTDRLWSEV